MLNLTLERIERQIRNLPVEHVYALAPDNSIVFHHTDNLVDQVTFPTRALAHLAIAVVTHNHPRGHSFSRQDVLLAREAELAQLRVVTARHRYSLRPPIAGWRSMAVEQFASALNREEALLKAHILAEIQAFRLTADLVDRVLHHRLWERMALLGLVRYAAEKW
jgi:hypothetical protein